MMLKQRNHRTMTDMVLERVMRGLVLQNLGLSNHPRIMRCIVSKSQMQMIHILAPLVMMSDRKRIMVHIDVTEVSPEVVEEVGMAIMVLANECNLFQRESTWLAVKRKTSKYVAVINNLSYMIGMYTLWNDNLLMILLVFNWVWDSATIYDSNSIHDLMKYTTKHET